jgi:quercetin dioxygenase-like cupin family protein
MRIDSHTVPGLKRARSKQFQSKGVSQMLRKFVPVLFLLLCATVAVAQDPVTVDSNHYKVEFENDEVRVLRVKVGPNEKSIMHQHPNAVAIFLTDTNAKFTFADGKSEDRNSKAGQVIWTPAIMHLPENTSGQPFEVILVELKSKAPTKKQD